MVLTGLALFRAESWSKLSSSLFLSCSTFDFLGVRNSPLLLACVRINSFPNSTSVLDIPSTCLVVSDKFSVSSSWAHWGPLPYCSLHSLPLIPGAWLLPGPSVTVICVLSHLSPAFGLPFPVFLFWLSLLNTGPHPSRESVPEWPVFWELVHGKINLFSSDSWLLV